MDIRETIDTLGADALGPREVSLYGVLAPVYDFVVERSQDYDAVASFVETHAPAASATVAVGACGSGHLLARLGDRYDTVVGLDRNRAMLDIAASRAETHLVVADLEAFVAPERFDLFTLMGGSLAHLPVRGRNGTDGVASVLANVYEGLAPGGVFVCDFMQAGALESGEVLVNTVESERVRVKRTVVTTATPDGADELGAGATFTYAYEITDRVTDETVRASTVVPVREFRTGAILGTALSAGFDDVSIVTPPTHGAAIVARRAE